MHASRSVGKAWTHTVTLAPQRGVRLHPCSSIATNPLQLFLRCYRPPQGNLVPPWAASGHVACCAKHCTKYCAKYCAKLVNLLGEMTQNRIALRAAITRVIYSSVKACRTAAGSEYLLCGSRVLAPLHHWTLPSTAQTLPSATPGSATLTNSPILEGRLQLTL